MKAEHRKELETNTLADRMGNVVQRVKTGRRTTVFLYLAVGAVLVVGGWFFYVSVIGGREEASRRWLMLDDAGLANLSSLIKNDPETPAGKAARLQRAWLAYWELGVKRLGAEPEGAMKSLEFASDDYAALAKICPDDPIFEPQALLGIAVVEETRAIQDIGYLDKAADAYQVLFNKYKDEDSRPKNAEAQFAKERLDKLNDKKQRAEIVATYEDLKKGLGVRVPIAGLPFDPINIPKKKN